MSYSQSPSSAAQNASDPLEGTYWKLVHLGDTPVNAASPQQEPHIVLDAQTNRVSGSGGCNRIGGRYGLSANQLRFREVVSTMMACDKGMDTERAFLAALEKVKTWKISGTGLQLFDSIGTPIASFEVSRSK